jgi:hypothetical protein
MLRKVSTIASLPVFLAAARFIPFSRLPTTCGFYRLTGLPCPSCGMTRSVAALAHLDWATAVEMNALGPAFVAVFAIWWLVAVYEIAIGRRTRLGRWARRNLGRLSAIGIAILFAYGIARIWLLTHL